jgi:hypothetical protein
MHASETWTSPKTNERLLSLFERVFICTFLAVQKNGIWRKRYNHELYQLFNEPDIVKCIKVNRLGWAQHVTHMDNKRILGQKEQGKLEQLN